MIGHAEPTGFQWYTISKNPKGGGVKYEDVTNLGYQVDADLSAPWKDIPNEDVEKFNQKTEEPEPEPDDGDNSDGNTDPNSGGGATTDPLEICHQEGTYTTKSPHPECSSDFYKSSCAVDTWRSKIGMNQIRFPLLETEETNCTVQ